MHTAAWLKTHTWESAAAELAARNVTVKDWPAPWTRLRMLVADNDGPLTREWGGLIIDVPTMTVVSYAWPTPDPDAYDRRVDWNLSQSTCYEIEDGIAMRYTYLLDDDNQGAWLLSTERYLHAHERRWIADRSFADLFEEAWTATTTTYGPIVLVPGYTHRFILLHPDARHVVPIEQPLVKYHGSRNMTTFATEHLYPHLPTPTVVAATTIKDVVDEVSKHSWLRGGVHVYEATDRSVHVQHPDFALAAEAKGNTVHMIEHVMHLVLQRDTAFFLQFFPEYTKLVNHCQLFLDTLQCYLSDSATKFQAWSTTKHRKMLPSAWYKAFQADRHGALTAEVAYHVWRLEMKRRYPDFSEHMPFWNQGSIPLVYFDFDQMF